jgi:hypothetical protein
MKYFLLAYEDGADRVFETLAFTLQAPVNHPAENIYQVDERH